MMTAPDRERVHTLDGMRGIAILLVIAGHVTANYQPLDPQSRHWLSAFANSSAGVRLFFVLSGYLITQLLAGELARTGTLSLPRFYWRRALRIFPAFYAFLALLTVAARWVPTGVNRDTFAAAATFTWNYGPFWITPPSEGTWNLGHLWTLALEQQFYLFWPVVLLLARPQRALWIAAVLMIWCPLARLGTYFLFPAQRGLVGIMLHTGVDSLMAGCIAGLLVGRPGILDHLRTHGRWLAALAAGWLWAASPVCTALIRGFAVALGFTVDALAAAVLIAWVHHAPSPRVARFLGAGPLPMLGLISYSLYIWQQVFLSPTGQLASGSLIIPVAAAGVVATVSYLLVERPALRLKSRVPSSTPSLPAAAIRHP